MSKFRPCGANKRFKLPGDDRKRIEELEAENAELQTLIDYAKKSIADAGFQYLPEVLKELEIRTKERDDAFEEVKWLRNELEELCRLSGWIIDEDGDGDGPHWERAIQRILQTTPDERKGK